MLLAVAALFAFETGAQYLYWMESGKFFSASRAHTAAQVVGTAESVAKVHPYFGWMLTYSAAYNERNSRLVQNLNFVQIAPYAKKFSGCCDVPMRPEDHKDKFIVAIMGNSIAEGIVHSMQISERFQEKLKRLPQAQGKQPLILSFAHGGHHQPQYLFILSYLLTTGTKLDMVVYYANVLETLTNVSNEEVGLAPEYPSHSSWVPLITNIERVADASASSLLGLMLVQARQASQKRLDECRIASCVMVNRPILNLQSYLAGKLETPAQTNQDPPHFINYYSTQPVSLDPTVYFPEAIASWQRGTTLMAALAKKAGVEFVEILLPTPYVHPREEPLEPRSGVRDYYRARVGPLIAGMVRAQHEMRSNGICSIDATHLLDDFSLAETNGYFDALGHLGVGGADAVMDFTADELLKGCQVLDK
jgi:hypothetical protein